MPIDPIAIERRIGSMALEEAELGASTAADIAFHMTDWLSDLERFHEFCSNPNNFTQEQLHELLIDFLVHVPNHVAAASKLLLGVPVTDVFGVGATEASNVA